MSTTKRHYVEVAADIALYVEETGEGRPLVFIPGWTMTTEVFAKQVPHFADRYRVVTYDPRCHGRSTKSTEGISYAQFGRDLGKLIDILRLDRPVLLGWSNGTLDVWELIRQRGIDDIAGLVLIDQSPEQVRHPSGEWTEFDIEHIVDQLRALVESHADYMRGLVPHAWQAQPPPGDIDWLVEQSTKTPEYAARLLAADAMARDATELAAAVDGRIPVLHVVNATHATAARSWLDRHSPSARLEALGRHLMFWEFPERFNAVVDRFLSDNAL